MWDVHSIEAFSTIPTVPCSVCLETPIKPYPFSSSAAQRFSFSATLFFIQRFAYKGCQPCKYLPSQSKYFTHMSLTLALRYIRRLVRPNFYAQTESLFFFAR